MWIAWFVGGVLLIAVGAVFAVGALLPRDHVATGSVVVAAPAAEVWRTVRTVGELPTWRPSVKRVEGIEGDGASPARWIEHGSGGTLPLTVESEDTPRVVVARIDDAKLPFGGTWTTELSPEGAGCRVRVTEQGFVNPAPFRFISKFLMGHDANLKSYLKDLSAKHGGSGVIEP